MWEILVIFLVSFLPGYLLLSLDKKLKNTERFCLSFGISFVILGALSVVLHLAGLSILWSLLIFIPLLMLAAYKKVRFDIPRMLVCILVLALVVRLVLQVFAQVPLTGDEQQHYLYAESFTTDNWAHTNVIGNFWGIRELPYPENYRPPFFNFIAGFFFNIFGPSFYVGKLLNCFIGTMLVVPVYLIAKKYGNDRIAIMAGVFVALSPVLIEQSLGMEVRLMGAYLALTAFYFFIADKKFWKYSAVFVGLLAITHQTEAIIIVLTFIVYLLLKDRKALFSQHNVALAAIVVLIMSPWLVRNYSVYGNPLYSTATQVMSIQNWEEYSTLSPPSRLELNLQVRAENMARTLLPVPVFGRQLNFDFVNNSNLNYQPMSAILTLPLLLIGLFYVASKLLRRDWDIIALYFTIGYVLFAIIWNMPNSFTYPFLFPQAVLLVVPALMLLEKMKESYRKIIWALVIVSLLAEVVVFIPRFSVPDMTIYDWVSANTAGTDILMSRDCQQISYFTGRKCVVTPYEDTATIVSFGKQMGVNYFVFGESDNRLRNLDYDILDRQLVLKETVAGYRIYR